MFICCRRTRSVFKNLIIAFLDPIFGKGIIAVASSLPSQSRNLFFIYKWPVISGPRTSSPSFLLLLGNCVLGGGKCRMRSVIIRDAKLKLGLHSRCCILELKGVMLGSCLVQGKSDSPSCLIDSKIGLPSYQPAENPHTLSFWFSYFRFSFVHILKNFFVFVSQLFPLHRYDWTHSFIDGVTS